MAAALLAAALAFGVTSSIAGCQQVHGRLRGLAGRPASESPFDGSAAAAYAGGGSKACSGPVAGPGVVCSAGSCADLAGGARSPGGRSKPGR